MHYEKHYKSEDVGWVLFIHGLGGSIATWKYQMEAFSDYNILCVDLQGHGESVFVKSDRPEQTAACDIHEILMNENIESVHIVSLSLGTIIAMEFAYMYPQSVACICRSCEIHTACKNNVFHVRKYRYAKEKSSDVSQNIYSRVIENDQRVIYFMD